MMLLFGIVAFSFFAGLGAVEAGWPWWGVTLTVIGAAFVSSVVAFVIGVMVGITNAGKPRDRL